MPPALTFKAWVEHSANSSQAKQSRSGSVTLDFKTATFMAKSINFN